MARCDSTPHTGVGPQHIASSHDHSYAESVGSGQLVQVLWYAEVDLGVEVVGRRLHLPVPEGDLRSIARIYTSSIRVHKYSRIDHHSGI